MTCDHKDPWIGYDYIECRKCGWIRPDTIAKKGTDSDFFEWFPSWKAFEQFRKTGARPWRDDPERARKDERDDIVAWLLSAAPNTECFYYTTAKAISEGKHLTHESPADEARDERERKLWEKNRVLDVIYGHEASHLAGHCTKTQFADNVLNALAAGDGGKDGRGAC